MRLQKKSLSRVSLNDLLRRKKTNLEKFLKDTGIVTYELLKSRCSSMGAVPPTEEQFKNAMGNPVIHEVSSPTEGIVVIPPMPEEVLPPTTAQTAGGVEPTDAESVSTDSQRTKKKSSAKKTESAD